MKTRYYILILSVIATIFMSGVISCVSFVPYSKTLEVPENFIQSFEFEIPDQEPEVFDPIPAGFPALDKYARIEQACLKETLARSPKKWVPAIWTWCLHRAWNSTRGRDKLVSKIDGSQIHDRDRPSADFFWTTGVSRDYLWPDSCPYHELDYSLEHPKASRQLAKNWPYVRPKMSPALRNRWLGHPYDIERFGARGPIDLNAVAFKVKAFRGCWAPKMLERKDVSAAVLVERSIEKCESRARRKKPCRSKWHLKEDWSK